MALKNKMAEKHEADLQETLGGRRTKASGSQFNDQTDGRHSHYIEPFAFAWDGKSTRGKSISISVETLQKLKDQAHGERPILPLRWYFDDRLRNHEDWVVVTLSDVEELREMALKGIKMAEVEKRLAVWDDPYEYGHHFSTLARNLLAYVRGETDSPDVDVEMQKALEGK